MSGDAVEEQMQRSAVHIVPETAKGVWKCKADWFTHSAGELSLFPRKSWWGGWRAVLPSSSCSPGYCLALLDCNGISSMRTRIFLGLNLHGLGSVCMETAPVCCMSLLCVLAEQHLQKHSLFSKTLLQLPQAEYQGIPAAACSVGTRAVATACHRRWALSQSCGRPA